MELPKRRDLPDYYAVIDKPMDMVTIASWMRGFKVRSTLPLRCLARESAVWACGAARRYVRF